MCCCTDARRACDGPLIALRLAGDGFAFADSSDRAPPFRSNAFAKEVWDVARPLGTEAGQATVEAAVLIPVLFVTLLALVQPALVLYDRVVMQAAAADACRLLVTKTDALGSMDDSVDAYVRHRLGAIPPAPCFHVHEGGCTWEVETEGGESSEQVSVVVRTKVRPLPLFDAAGALAGILDGDGLLTVEVRDSRPTQPIWIGGTTAGLDPAGWIGAWA